LNAESPACFVAPTIRSTSGVRVILNIGCSQQVIGCADAYTKSRRQLAFAWAQEGEHIEAAYVLEHKIKE